MLYLKKKWSNYKESKEEYKKGQRFFNEETNEMKLGLIILKEKWLQREGKVHNKTCQFFLSTCQVIAKRNNLFSTPILDSSAVLIAIRMSFPKVNIALNWKGLLQMVQESPTLEVFNNSLNHHIRNGNYSCFFLWGFELSFRPVFSNPACSDAL